MTQDKQSIFNSISSQVKAAFDRWYQGDPFGYLDLMAEEMTYFSPFANSLVDGKGAVVAAIAPIEGQIHGLYELVSPDLQLGESMAVHSYRLNELDHQGDLTAGYKVTEVYRQVGDKWLMIHAHFSTAKENE
jgi:hypothetical protein